jgi:hypothetical protein
MVHIDNKLTYGIVNFGTQSVKTITFGGDKAFEYLTFFDFQVFNIIIMSVKFLNNFNVGR